MSRDELEEVLFDLIYENLERGERMPAIDLTNVVKELGKFGLLELEDE